MAEVASGEHAHHGPKHDYNLVDPSPWPFVGSMSALALTAGAVMWMHGSTFGGLLMTAGFLAVLFTMFVWFRDVIRESVRGDYSERVASMLRIGMVLFIASEVLFFFGFFWAFFWGALVPPELIRTTWPPEGVHNLPTWGIPFFNTLILLLSGCTITWAHHALREGDKPTTFKALALTVALGVTLPRLSGLRVCRAGPRGAAYRARHLRLGLLHGHGLPRLPRAGRHHLPHRLHHARLVRCFEDGAACRLRGCRLVLALRRRGLALPLRLGLLVGWQPVVDLRGGSVGAASGKGDSSAVPHRHRSRRTLPRLRSGTPVCGLSPGGRALRGLRCRSA